MPLSDTAINNAKPGAKPIKLSDEKGLFLLVTPAGGKWWRFDYRFHGARKTLSLGVYPSVGLRQARDIRDQYRQAVAEGIDPSVIRKEEKAAQRADKARQIVATRFMLDNDGALSFCLGNRRLILTPTETSELRNFLDATRAVTPKVKVCP